MRVLVLLLLTTLSAAGQLPELERILLPIYSADPVAGAYDSRWETILTVRNLSDKESFLFPQNCPRTIPPNLCLTLTSLRPGATIQPYFRNATSAQPIMLNVTRELADRIAVQLRVRDLSRQSESYGIDIPIVRTGDFRSGPRAILDVPDEEGFRVTLRIYADRVAAESQLQLRFVSESTKETKTIDLTIKPLMKWPPGEPIVFPDFYYTVPDVIAFTQFTNGKPMRIELVPDRADLRYWAFATVTSNSSQHFTTLVAR